MKARDRAFWARLCVLVVIVLVLAALVLSHSWGKDASAAAAVGGALAALGGARHPGRPHSAAGKAARGGRGRRAVHGGAPSDLHPAKISEPLGFPADQAASEAEHQNLRALLSKAIERYISDRGAPIGPLTPSTPPNTGVPAGGWAGADAAVTDVISSFGSMCDVMRGDMFAPNPAWPSAPWNNPAVPGPASRLATWNQHLASLKAALASLDRLLANALGADLLSKALFKLAADELAGANWTPAMGTVAPAMPVPPVPGPVPAISPSWVGMVAAAYTKDGADGAYIKAIRDRLTVALTTYISDGTTTPDLRAGSLFDVASADQAATTAADAFTKLAANYTAGPVTHAHIARANHEWANLRNALQLWADHLNIAGISAGGNQKAYKALVGVIGTNMAVGTAVGARGKIPATSVRGLVGRLKLPPIPALAKQVAGSVVGDVNLFTNAAGGQPGKVKASVVDFSKQLKKLRELYVACRKKAELNWDVLDGLEAQVEANFAALARYYLENIPLSIDRRRGSIALVQGVRDSVEAFCKAVQGDEVFRAAAASQTVADLNALVNVDPRAPRGGFPKTADELRLAGAGIPPADLAPLKARVNDLSNPVNFGAATIRGLGDRVRKLLAAVEYQSPPTGGNVKWHGVRQQFDYLRKGLFINPDLNPLYKVEQDALAVAEACFGFARSLDGRYIAQFEAAKAALTGSLSALDALVANEPLTASPPAIPEVRIRFANAIRRAQNALAAIPALAVPPVGAPAVVAPSRPLMESERLIRLDAPPVDPVIFTPDVDAVSATARTDVVLEATSTAALEDKVGRLPAAGPRLVYGLVVDKPGDMVALYKAVAIALKLKLPEEIARKVADRKRAATGWLYDVVRFESGAYYTRLREYIKPELYAVDA